MARQRLHWKDQLQLHEHSDQRDRQRELNTLKSLITDNEKDAGKVRSGKHIPKHQSPLVTTIAESRWRLSGVSENEGSTRSYDPRRRTG